MLHLNYRKMVKNYLPILWKQLATRDELKMKRKKE